MGYEGLAVLPNCFSPPFSEKIRNFNALITMEQDTNNIYLVDRKPRTCPCCGGKVVPILYGEPSSEAFEKADRGEIVLGGCIIFADMPEYQCTGCGAQFRKPIRILNSCGKQ